MKNRINRKPEIAPEQAKHFVEVFCRSTTYREVAEKLNKDIGDVMYMAQFLRATVPNLPYLKMG